MSVVLQQLAQEIQKQESSGLIECVGPLGSGRLKFLRSLLPSQLQSGRIAWIESRFAVGPGLLRWLKQQSLSEAVCFDLRGDVAANVLEVLRSRLFRFVFLSLDEFQASSNEVGWLRVRQTARQVNAWVFVLSSSPRTPRVRSGAGLQWMWNYRFQVHKQDEGGVHLEVLKGPNKGEKVCSPLLRGCPLVPTQKLLPTATEVPLSISLFA